MAAIAAARKSRLHNAFEGLALTATLQSFPTFATAAMLLKLFGNHDLVGDPASPSSSPWPRSPTRWPQ